MSAAVLFIPDVPEFASVVSAASGQPGCAVSGPTQGYHVIRAEESMTFNRRALGLKPAVWYGIPTGGLIGEIAQFDRDTLTIKPAA